MLTKLDHVRKLLAEGYELDEVESDHGHLEATLRRGTRIVVVKFLPSEAERLLLMRSPMRL